MLNTSQKYLGIIIIIVISILSAQPAYKLETQEGRVPGKITTGFELLPTEKEYNFNFQTINDETVETGYTYRYSYSRDNRSVDDTLYYDLPWEAYFTMYPGDVMVTAFQMPADATLKGVNVPVYRWGGTGEELTVSVHALSYPYGSDGVMYDQGLVNSSGWLAGYDDDNDGLMELEGTTWDTESGYCTGQTMISNATDPLGSTAAASGPPNTPTMGLLWPDGSTAATLNPTDNPGIENGGGDNWVSFTDYGSEVGVSSGDWIGVVVHYTGTGVDGDHSIGFQYAAYDGISPWRSFKFYEDACGGTGGESGWYIRGWAFNYQLAAELTGDRGPIFGEMTELLTTISTDDRSFSVNVTDDNPSGGSAGVSAVTLSYQLDDLSSTIYTVDMTMTSGDAEDGTWAGDMPGQSLGTRIYWWLTAEDINENTTVSLIYSYSIMSEGLVEVPGDFSTIQEAINFSGDGDTVLVSAGTYVENLVIDQEIVVIGTNRETTIIDGDSSGSVVYFGSNAGMDTYFSGFTVQNGTGTYVNEYPSGYSGGGIFLYSGAQPHLTNIIVQNNTTNGSGAGIYVWNNAGGTALKLTNSIVRNNSTIGQGHMHGGGIFNGSSNSIVSDVEFYGNYATGVGGGLYDGNSMLVTNCLFRDNVCDYEGDALGCSGTKIFNSTIVNNGSTQGGGQCVINISWDTIIQNSIIWDNIHPQIFNNNRPVNIDYSIIDGGQNSFSELENLNWGTGNLSSDPLFTDATNNDFSLASGSPAIDTGNPNGFYKDSNGSQNDMGYTGGNGIVVTPLTLDFGNVGIGNNALTENIFIINARNDSLILASYSTTDNQFTVTYPSLPVTIQSLEKRSFNVQFLPIQSGEQSSTLQLSFSNLANNNGSFTAVGIAYDVPAGDIHVPADAPTIQLAIDIAPSGKTIVVAPGEYFENLIMKSHISLISSGGPAETIINGNNDGMVINGQSAGDVTVDGFTITNGNGSGGGGGAIDFYGQGPINLKNLIVTGNTAMLPVIISAYDTTVIENVVIVDNNQPGAGYGPGGPVALEIIRGNDDAEVVLKNVTIANNGELDGINIQRQDNNQWSVKLFNCVIWTETSSINTSDVNNNQSLYVYNSLIRGGESEIFNQNGELNVNWGEGNIDSYPYFNDPDSGDYSLSANSPMIGAGASSITIGGITYDAPTTDVLGVDRPSPSGTSPDIGAYENPLGIPQYQMSIDSVYFVHGDTALVPIRNHSLSPSLNSIDLKIAGFQGKLGFVDLVTDSSTIFGSLGWITQYNNTDTLLITASAGANPVDSSGVLFALKLAVPDTLSSQFIPINITDFTGNVDYTDFSVTAGGVQVVWGPTIGFTSTETLGDYPLTVTFTDTSNAGTFPITTWSWDFGDDSTASGQTTEHTYSLPGIYDVSLNIADEFGLTDTLVYQELVQLDTVYGDVDWNTAVQSYDGSLILKDLAEMIELDTLQRIVGDVSGDSSLSTLDATLILQYVVGLITELPYDPGTQFLATGDLSMEDHGVAPGSVAAVPINITSGSNIYGFEAVLEFDPAVLEFDTLLLSETMANYLIITNPLEEGVVKVVTSGSNVDGNEGVFATLYFNVSNDFTDATVIQINNLRWNEGEVVENAAEMTLSYALGIGEELLPNIYALHQNYPNPFNPITTLRYDLPENSYVNVTIYDMLGREVKTLVNSAQDAGFKSVIWNATNDYGKPVSAGVYLYKIQAGEFVQTRKMVLLK